MALLIVAPSATENAVANGDTRTLHFYHTHTGESIDATFRVDGHYDPEVLRQLNHFLRDWRNNDETNMDPRLFDAIWEAYRSAGATDRIQIYSAYRSPETNAMLRRRSRAVAEHSQHMLGKAMDTTMPGFPMSRIRDAGMKLQHGGVGWYPSANFVHLDVGGVRSWPRMPYDQLMSLFPDGKTVHIASNGQTLPGYEQARAELAQRGETDLPPSQESGGFFAWLFSGFGNTAGAAHEDEEDRRVSVASAAPPPVQQEAQPAPQEAPAPQASPAQPAALAYAEPAAPPQGQPIDDRAQQVVAQPPAGEQVAALEPPADADSPVALGGVLPLPPRRPADLAATPEIPLPPVRPNSLSRLQTASASIRFPDASSRRADAIGNLITATASGLPMLRRSGLPALITQGGSAHRRAPGQALAFAPDEVVATDNPTDFAPASEPIARPGALARSTGLRSRGDRGPAMPSATSATAGLDAPVIVGPRLTGLRKAAGLSAEKASL